MCIYACLTCFNGNLSDVLKKIIQQGLGTSNLVGPLVFWDYAHRIISPGMLSMVASISITKGITEQ